jgi:hypothetical protein
MTRNTVSIVLGSLRGAATKAIVVLSATIVVASCSSSPPSPPTQPAITAAPTEATPGPTNWTLLETPLQLPTVEAGATCPRSTGTVVSPAFGPGLGSGPVYPVGLGTDGFLELEAAGDAFRQKVLWVASAAYAGPVLIRGRRLDAAGTIEFGAGSASPSEEFRLMDGTARSPGQEPGWREWPSLTYVPSSGCYAYQVDGIGFTATIVFDART